MRMPNTIGDALRDGWEIVATCHDPGCRHQRLVDLEKVIHHVGAGHQLLPVHGQPHFSERLRCPVCGRLGMHVWPGRIDSASPLLTSAGSFGYVVRNWYQDAVLAEIARANHTLVAHAAFDAAVKAYPGRRLTLQQGSLLVRDSRMTVIRGGRE